MILKPQYIVILLKFVTIGDQQWSYGSLAYELAMSPSEVHCGIGRAAASRLFDAQRKVPILRAHLEFLVHWVKYAFTPDKGQPTRDGRARERELAVKELTARLSHE